MTDLKPEDRALIERLEVTILEMDGIIRGSQSPIPYTMGNVRSILARVIAETKEVLDAARAEGPRTDCYECGTHDVIGPICAQCNPDLAAMVRAEGLLSPSGAADRLGAWLSAALDDPSVCDAMKADIRAWFDVGQPTPPPRVVEALDWFGQNENLSLEFDWSDADTDGLDWVIYRENGGRNDREWTVVASGPTPQAAILAAYRAAPPSREA